PIDSFRSEGARNPVQHLWRDHPLRRGRARDRRRGQAGGATGPSRRAARRGQRGRGPADPPRGRLHRREPDGGRGEGSGGGGRQLGGTPMSVLLDQNTRLLVQGITGREGEFHTRKMLQYGTPVVAGVTPGRGGQNVADVPVFDTVRGAVEK